LTSAYVYLMLIVQIEMVNSKDASSFEAHQKHCLQITKFTW